MTTIPDHAPPPAKKRWPRATTRVGTALVPLSLLLFLGVTFDAQSDEVGMALHLTEADNGRSVDVRIGDEITLALPENPTTGYRWATDGLDTQLLTLTEQPYTADSPALGSGGTAQWVLRPIAPGVTTLKLKQWRPWEGDPSIVGRYEITLQITP